MSHDGRKSSASVASENDDRKGPRVGYGFGKVRCARGSTADRVESAVGIRSRSSGSVGAGPVRLSSGDGIGVICRAGEGEGEGGASDEGDRRCLLGVVGPRVCAFKSS